MASREIRLILLWCALAAVGILGSVSQVYVIRLGALGLLLALVFLALPWLARAYPFLRGTATIRGREVDLEAAGRRLVPPLFLAFVTSAIAWPLLLGDMPRSQDHTVHLARAWIFTQELLGQGRLTGWSSYWFAGYPAGQLYPPGSDLWLTVFRALHLGLPDWSVTYAHAFLAFLVVGTLAMYWLGVRATSSRLVGFIAGLFWLVDPGAYREGGWNFTVYWGVWTQVLGQIAAAASLASLDRVLEKNSPRWAGATAAFLGFSLLCHPMSAVTLAIMIPAYLACRWVFGALDRERLAISVGIMIWGSAIAAWWFLPFLTRGDWTIRVPELWRSMDQAAGGVIDGAVFQNHWPILGVLALVGCVRAAISRRPLMLGLAISAVVLLFLSTSTAFEQLRLEDLSASFGRIIYQRFSIPAKMSWFVLVGFGVLTIVEGLQKAGDSHRSALTRWRAIALAGLCGLLCAPFTLHGVTAFVGEYSRGVGAIGLASVEPDYGEYRRFLDWSQRQWQERDRFYRIAYLQPRNEHFMADAPVYNSTPAYKVGWTPCTTFRLRPESDDPEVLRALSVRYVVSRSAVSGPHVVPEKRFGRIRVYRLRDERPERFTIVGSGQAEVLQFDEEHIRISVTGASADTRLKVHVANYADWQATIGSDVISQIRTAPIYGNRYPTFIQVDVPHDGVVALRFVRPPLRVVAQVVSVIALICLVLVLRTSWTQRLEPLWTRLAPAAMLATRSIPFVLALCALGLVTIAGVRLAGRPRGALGPLAYSFAEHLEEARGAVLGDEGELQCTRRHEKLLCGRGGRGWVGVKRVKVGIVERPCIWAPPVGEGPLQITFSSVPIGSSLVGRHGLSDFAATQTPEGTPVKLRVTIEDGPSATFVAPNEVGWRPWELDTSGLSGERRAVTLEVTSDDDYRREYCFDGGVWGGGASSP